MLRDDIQKDVISSLKAGKTADVKVLRFIMSEIKYAEIEKGNQLTDGEVVNVLQKEVKKRKEAIEMFRKGQRNDLVKDEEQQLIIIGRYLPGQISEKELNDIIDRIIISLDDKRNIGRIIGTVIAKVKGRTDGSVVARLVRQKLQESGNKI